MEGGVCPPPPFLYNYLDAVFELTALTASTCRVWRGLSSSACSIHMLQHYDIHVRQMTEQG